MVSVTEPSSSTTSSSSSATRTTVSLSPGSSTTCTGPVSARKLPVSVGAAFTATRGP